MTINALRRRGRGAESKRAPAREPEPLAIGESGRDIFNCPSCARPLGVGSNHCPGCGTWLVLGVQGRRAGLFVTLGLIVGMLIGGTISTSYLALTRSLAPATSGDSTGAVPSAAPTFIPVADPVVTPAGLSALRQTAILNERLVGTAVRLHAALMAPSFDANEIARAIRAINGDASVGAELAARAAAWAPATSVSTELAAAYQGLATIAREGLRAPLRDPAAYRTTAERMIASLAALGEVDALARAIVAAAATDAPTAP
jgi:hypothetical protein